MRLTALAGIIVLFALAKAPAVAADESRHAPAVLSFLYPISTNHDAQVDTWLRLSLLYGNVGAVHGIDLNGVAARTRGDVVGAQFAGVYSRTDGDFSGAQFVLGGAWVRGDVRGAQLSIIATVNGGDTRGAMAGGVMNLVNGTFGGAQIAIAANIIDQSATGVLITGFGNIVGGNFHGVSFAGGYNYAAGRATGLQLGGVNYATRAHGVQFGVANFAGTAGGLQVGIVNYADQQNGVPIGMVNAAGNGMIEAVVYSSNQSTLHVGVRTEVHHVTSMLTLGGGDRLGDVERSAILTWNLGAAFHPIHRVELGADVGLAHYMPTNTSDPAINDQLHPATQWRVTALVGITKNARLLLGVGESRVYESYEDNPASEKHGLFLAGVTVR